MTRLRLAFDLDGTLVDSIVDLADSANQMVQSFGGERLAVTAVADMVGEGAAELVRRVLAAADLSVDPKDGLERFLEIYDQRLLNVTEPYRDIPNVLTQASQRHALAVLTNKPAGMSTKILDGLQLAAFFDQVIGGDGPYPRKPDPAGLNALMAGYEPRHTALIGDSPVDEQTAKAAGCHFICAKYGFGSRRYGTSLPDTPFIVQHPGEILAAIQRLEEIVS
jgi:phosphoglycolate phosphatase